MKITTFDHSEFYFVFGANLAGRHGKGAALTAKRSFGAEYGVGEGLTGKTYALPTKNEKLQSRSLPEIGESISRFIDVAGKHPDKKFMVTRVGCGLSGFRDDEILHYFRNEQLPSNIYLPGVWLNMITTDQVTRVIIAGGRDFTYYDILKEKCLKILSGCAETTIQIVSGAAPGADSEGEKFCKEMGDIDPARWELVRFPANWKQFKKPGGMLRNAAMAWYSTHLIAFWDGASRGTKNMIEIAECEGLASRVVKYQNPANLIKPQPQLFLPEI